MTDHSSPLDAGLLDRYLTNDCSPDERGAVDAWIAQDPAHATVTDALRTASLTGAPAPHARDPQVAWARLNARLRALPHGYLDMPAAPITSVERPTRRPATGGRWRGIAVAAAACGLALAAFVGHRRTTLAPASSAANVYTTAVGQRATLTLADGSTVTLAPGTRLTVPEDFRRATRTVELVGEAYFQVADANAAPFVVRTGAVSVRVLGTAFDVKRYTTDRTTRVVVTQGKVQTLTCAACTTPQAVTLTRGMIAHADDSVAIARAVDDAERYVGWTKGRLDFKDAPVSDVLGMMERWYGLRFRLADSTLLRDEVSGSLDFHSTQAALSYLKTLLDVQMTYDRRGDTTVVTLHPRHTRPMPAPVRRDLTPLTQQSEVGR